MAKASIHIKRTKVTIRKKVKKGSSGNNKKGNTNRCPSCGRFLWIRKTQEQGEN